MLQPVRVFAVTTISRATAWLHVSNVAWLWAQRTEECHRVESTSTHFHIQRLHNDAALTSPIILQCQDQALKGFNIVFVHRKRTCSAISAIKTGKYTHLRGFSVAQRRGFSALFLSRPLSGGGSRQNSKRAHGPFAVLTVLSWFNAAV